MFYSRVYNKNTYYSKLKLPSLFLERYIIRWKPNHETKFHDHNGKKCEFMLLSGNLIEITNKKNITDTNCLNKYEINYIDDNMGVHKIKNYNKHSYSYHVYY
jgi:hypothetical protein